MSNEGYEVEIKVKEILGKGVCALGIEPGDKWIARDDKVPNNICSWAFSIIFPMLQVLRYGGEFPWEENKDKTTLCCIDPANPVVFELTRIKS